MRQIRALALVALVSASAACTVSSRDVSAEKPYANMIGRRYEVIADHLDAYGVFKEIGKPELDVVELIALRPGVGGVEYAFRRNVPKGRVVRIVSARHRPVLFERGIYYLVEVENWDLPAGIPVELALSRDNEGEGAELNPTVFKRLSAP